MDKILSQQQVELVDFYSRTKPLDGLTLLGQHKVGAKELFTWSPCFFEYKDPGYLSEDESSLDGNNNLGKSQQGTDDLFGLYDLLRKSTNLSTSKEDPSLLHPLGFTPVASHQDPIHSNSAHLEASHGNDSSADSFNHVSSRSTSGYKEKQMPSCGRLKLNMSFPNRLSSDQVDDLDKDILIDEIRKAVWDCAVNCFFDKGRFLRGSNSSFIALIPKVMDAKFIIDFCPVSLIGSIYKVVTKILANCLTTVISDLISNTQFALVAKEEEASFGSSSLSHLFYADDAIFIGEWSIENLNNLLKILNCFHLALGLCINMNKSHVLGVGVPLDIIRQGALRIGYEVMQTPFKYLGVMVGDHMSRYSAWSNTIQKVHGRLSRWKVKTLSIGGRLTLLKSVLGAVPIYNMSLYKAPKCVLHELERLRNNFFKGGDSQDMLFTVLDWSVTLAIPSLHGVLSYEKFIRGGLNTRFWFDTWILDFPLNVRFPRLFSLELDKYISVAAKWSAPSFETSFKRHVRDGVERNQWSALFYMLGTITLSSSPDSLDHLPTRGNLISRGVTLDSPLCPICELSHEDSGHLFFSCELGKSISQRICRWSNIQWEEVSYFID
nr:RNA-directed DNA polymerase, eukaryota, reverse transcriptase zinc-binding domain protein [Tanacetum cinerariifolium]